MYESPSTLSGIPNYVGRSVFGNTINELTKNAYQMLSDVATSIPSRNGDCYSLYDFTYRLLNPRARYLNLTGRTSNIFQLIGETLWILAGSSDVTGYLETMLPRAPQYSDDGIHWRAGYGPRLYRYNQLTDVIEFFRKDGKMTRRAVISIHDPSMDTFTGLKQIDGLEDSKDFACNLMLMFYVTPNDKFNCKVINRSNDSVFGMGINVTEFSVIQEMIYEQVKKFIPEISLGMLTVNSNNFHAYTSTWSQIDAVIESNDLIEHEAEEYKSLGVYDITACQKYMEFFISNVTKYDGEHSMLYSGDIGFDPHGTLADYCTVMLSYFASKNGNPNCALDVTDMCKDLVDAILASKYRKFPVVIGAK